jgi:hypothetical protein
VKGFFPWILVFSGIALAQQSNQQPPPPAQSDPKANQQKQQQDKQASQPLFKNKMGYKSSSTSKESTTLGFNGIDPSGKVDQKMLAATPTATDEQKVKQMSANKPTPADLKTFLEKGGLNSK